MLNVKRFSSSYGMLNVVTQNETTQDRLANHLTTVGRASNIEVKIESPTQVIYERGKIYPSSTNIESIEINGSINRVHINGALLKLLLVTGDHNPISEESYPPPIFCITIAAEEKEVITLYNVEFQTWNPNIPEDDFVLENLSFKARSFIIGDEVQEPILSEKEYLLEFPSGLRVRVTENAVGFFAGKTKMILKMNGDISIESSGNLDLKALGELRISAQKISIESISEINMTSGTALTAKAGTQVTLNGLNVSIKGITDFGMPG
jgi:hypothetical protein